MAEKLRVKDLKISFRTPSGRVQAVRGISFDLSEGETLAIVGESGSGKSVTSKAILGILAGNSTVEGGEIVYDGKDLLRIPEEEFHRIRGDRISMIFQDPLSSLNPIVRIGKQLTEAMILKGKARRRACRRDFNNTLRRLNGLMIEAVASDAAHANKITRACKDFNRFEFKHIELEKEYNDAFNLARGAIYELENLLFLIEKNALTDARRTVGDVIKMAKGAVHEYVVSARSDELFASADAIKRSLPDAIRSGDYSSVARECERLLSILREATELDAPNFFSMGYYLTFSSDPLPALPINELNAFLRKYLDEHFMLEFITNVRLALEFSADKSYSAKEVALKELRSAAALAADPATDGAALAELARRLITAVEASIDRAEINKDGMAYVFASGLKNAIEVYNSGVRRNARERARYDKQMAEYDAAAAKRGVEPDPRVAPPATVDLELARGNIVRIITRLADAYEARLAVRAERNYGEEAIAVIDYLKQNASGVVNRVTRRMARAKAIKLMEEVGIPEPRRRFEQYPFEFSGGMRQRIVIAIALAADPDVLICDEPTTALDVTIQAQILELINRLKAERNLSIIFITHDLGVVASMADRIAVMYAGRIVEYGTSDDIFYDPRHPYTWALLSSMPDLDTTDKLEAIPGTPPNMIYPPVGDAFAARNKYAMQIDFEMQPPTFKISDTHSAATWLLHPDAPRVEIPEIIRNRIERMNRAGGYSDVE